MPVQLIPERSHYRCFCVGISESFLITYLRCGNEVLYEFLLKIIERKFAVWKYFLNHNHICPWSATKCTMSVANTRWKRISHHLTSSHNHFHRAGTLTFAYICVSAFHRMWDAVVQLMQFYDWALCFSISIHLPSLMHFSLEQHAYIHYAPIYTLILLSPLLYKEGMHQEHCTCECNKRLDTVPPWIHDLTIKIITLTHIQLWPSVRFHKDSDIPRVSPIPLHPVFCLFSSLFINNNLWPIFHYLLLIP